MKSILLTTVILIAFASSSFAEKTCKEAAKGSIKNIDILCDDTTSLQPIACFNKVKLNHGTDKEKSILCAGTTNILGPINCYYNANASNMDAAILCSGVTENNWKKRLECYENADGSNWAAVKACAKRGLKYLDKLNWDDH